MESKVKCIGQNTVLIQLDGKKILVDPTADAGIIADIILYSGKVFSLDVLQSSISEKTLILSSPLLTEAMAEIANEKVFLLPKTSHSAYDIAVETLPAYRMGEILSGNLDRYNGYLIRGKTESFYFSGPTDIIPEMNLIEVNCAFLSVAGPTMTIFEAVAATNIIAAEAFVPIGYCETEAAGIAAINTFVRKAPSAKLFRD